jgi:hypothetical protein
MSLARAAGEQAVGEAISSNQAGDAAVELLLHAVNHGQHHLRFVAQKRAAPKEGSP